jgi:hypothetical protein
MEVSMLVAVLVFIVFCLRCVVLLRPRRSRDAPERWGLSSSGIAGGDLFSAPGVDFGFDKTVGRRTNLHGFRKLADRDEAVDVLAREGNSLVREFRKAEEFDGHVDDTLR